MASIRKGEPSSANVEASGPSPAVRPGKCITRAKAEVAEEGKGPKRTYKDSASWKIGRLHAMKLILNHFVLEEHKLFVSLIPNEAMLIVSCGMVIDRGK